MILRLGSKGQQVKELQEFLGIPADGHFGPQTEKAVVLWQNENNLTGDGVVGPKTWEAMELASTDSAEKLFVTDSGMQINKYFLPPNEYKPGPTKKSITMARCLL